MSDYRVAFRFRAPRGEPCVVITQTAISCNGVRLTKAELRTLKGIALKLREQQEKTV